MKLPSIATYRKMLSENAVEMIAAAREFRDVAKSHNNVPTVRILNRSAAGLEKDHRIASLQDGSEWLPIFNPELRGKPVAVGNPVAVGGSSPDAHFTSSNRARL